MSKVIRISDDIHARLLKLRQERGGRSFGEVIDDLVDFHNSTKEAMVLSAPIQESDLQEMKTFDQLNRTRIACGSVAVQHLTRLWHPRNKD